MNWIHDFEDASLQLKLAALIGYATLWASLVVGRWP
jgi:hypothetical protein